MGHAWGNAQKLWGLLQSGMTAPFIMFPPLRDGGVIYYIIQYSFGMVTESQY